MAKNGRTDAVKIYRDRAIAAEQRVGQLEAQIVHLWRHGRGCGAQTCGLCHEVYATYKRHYALAADDE